MRCALYTSTLRENWRWMGSVALEIHIFVSASRSKWPVVSMAK